MSVQHAPHLLPRRWHLRDAAPSMCTEPHTGLAAQRAPRGKVVDEFCIHALNNHDTCGHTHLVATGENLQAGTPQLLNMQKTANIWHNQHTGTTPGNCR